MSAFNTMHSTVLLAALGVGITLVSPAPVSAAEVVIQMLGDGTDANQYRFEPKDVTISSGDTIKWSNNFGSNTKHTATPDKEGFTDTGDVVQGAESAPQTIEAAAEPIPYHCEYHPTVMTGTITVGR
jgi:plastocyanin